MTSSKPRLVVFFGGDTGSHRTSLSTGQWFCEHAPRERYEITPVLVQTDGTWQVPLGSLPRRGTVQRMITHLFANVRPLAPAAAMQRLLQRPLHGLLSLLRGRGGDDGALQHLGQSLHIPVIGSSADTHQQTFHKHLCYQRVDGIATTPTSLHFKRTAATDSVVASVRERFPLPLFIKPDSQEVSLGVEEVTSADELTGAIQRAQQTGDILVQPRISGRELNVTLTTDTYGNTTMLPPTVIIPRHTTYYDHQAKHYPGRVTFHTPPETDTTLLQQVETIARQVYHELNCQGYASFDFMADKNNLTLLEVNMVPTHTGATPLVHQLKAAGIHPSTFAFNLLRQDLS